MRSRASAVVVALAALTALWAAPSRAAPAVRASAQPAADPDTPDENATSRARQHFQNGIKLFRSADFAGALAEFEAAYRLKPGASSLQNVALCLKELHRYAEAATALDTLLKRHADELSEHERNVAADVVRELDELTATLTVRVTPTDASVTLDGRALAAEEQARGVRVGVGEHTLKAEAPGYESAAQIVRVASGEKRDVALQARPVSGFVSVVTSDRDAAVAIDGTPLAFQRWTGPVAAGEHYVQVYKPGYQAFEKRLSIEVGKTEIVTPPPLSPADAPEPASSPSGPLKPQRGFYALGTLGAMGMLDSPQSIDQDRANVEGGALGLRGGYRVYAPVAVELMLEGGRNRVEGACKSATASSASSSSACLGDTVNYELGSVRVGPNLRLMSTGSSLRFVSTLGAGASIHRLEFENKQGTSHVEGADPYFLIELGAAMNLGHLLLETALSFYIEGMSSIGTDSEVQFDPAVLKMIGIGGRAGYRQWRSPKK